MSWRERLLEANFRHVAFHVDSHDYAGGRHIVVHEFPGRDEPFAEDLGRRARTFTVNAYVLGPDYDFARDRLREALEQSQPGVLVHPYLGFLTVRVGQVSLRESTREGGLAHFSVTFHEAGALRTLVAPATQERVKAAAARTLAEAIAAFGRDYNVLGMAGDYVAELQGDLDGLLGAVEGAAAGATSAAAALIRAPFNLAASIAGSINRVQALLNDPLRAFGLYRDLFGASSSRAPLTTTPGRRRQASAQASLTALVRQTALGEGANALAAVDFESGTQAADLGDSLLDGIDAAQADAGDGVDQALADLRAAVAADVSARGAGLPRAVTFTPEATLPALVIAHNLYGDATRDADIVARNALRHPGFVPAGEPLEVLSDA